MPIYRFRFLKQGDLRFISHLDLSHAFERAARRASIPLAFTQGFHPHPKIAFATALSVGTTSEAEYVDIEMDMSVTLERLMESLNASLPDGLSLVRGIVVNPPAKSLMASVSSASYRVGIIGRDIGSSEIESACSSLLSRETTRVKKRTKSGWGEVDIRPFILSLEVAAQSAPGEPVEVTMLLACGSNGMAKPEDVLEALKLDSSVGPETRVVYSHRTGLFKMSADGRLIDLLEA